MRDALYRAVGRASVLLDPLRAVLATGHLRLRPGDVGPLGHDKTGLVVREARGMRVLHQDAEVLYVEQDSFAHSFWRAQELSLFHLHRHLLAPPLLDFGAGDGSFASALFEHVSFGADNDPEALEVARQFGVYDRLIQVAGSLIPLPDGAAGAVFSNSVLEHVLDLPAVLRELRRVLAPGGALVFTVPIAAFTDQMATYFGRRVAERVNLEASHRNLLDPDGWTTLLTAHGFRVEEIRRYQPPRFTFWYRMFRLLGRRGLARFWPRLPSRVWSRYGPRLVESVRSSIAGAPGGANVFVVAR